MKLALIGATGRTGTHVLAAALGHGHDVTVVVRDPDKLDSRTRAAVRVVVGDATDPGALTDLVTGVDAMVSALIAIMSGTGPRRVVGISGAGIDVPGDRKSAANKVISALIQLLGGADSEESATADGLVGAEGSFVLCTFSLVNALARRGEHARRARAASKRGENARASALFERVVATANEVGLPSEEYDVPGQRMLGNFPQAFSHLGLVNSARLLHLTAR